MAVNPALDGFSAESQADAEHRVAQLNEKIARRFKGKGMLPMPIMQVWRCGA